MPLLELYQNDTTDSLDPSTLPTSESSPSLELPLFAHLSIGIVVIFLMIIVIIISLLLFKFRQKYKKSRKFHCQNQNTLSGSI